MSLAQHQRAIDRAAQKLARETGSPVLIAAFDVAEKKTIVIATSPNPPGTAELMVSKLHEMLTSTRVKRVCSCGRLNCPNVGRDH